MDIQGLDYNTQRTKLIMSEYGREIQDMVEHAITLPTKESRLACAKQIINTMRLITQTSRSNNDKINTLWNHLAVISGGRLDIDYPVDITLPDRQGTKPDAVPYPGGMIPVKHYGKELFLIFEKLKTMEDNDERMELVKMTANQMKRCLILWGRGNCDDEKVADDLSRFTDGVIQLDLSTFRFDNLEMRSVTQAAQLQNQNQNQKKKKKK